MQGGDECACWWQDTSFGVADDDPRRADNNNNNVLLLRTENQVTKNFVTIDRQRSKKKSSAKSFSIPAFTIITKLFWNQTVKIISKI
jgi:hypothetical protein